MTISYNWLNQLLPTPLPLTQLSDILTSVGLEVESIEESSAIKGGLQGLVVGKIVSAVKHPNADKLQVCMVDIGTDTPSQIVCGAPNARVGLTVITALPDTTLYPTAGEPFVIKKSKIRGEESLGMLCGEDEIGLGSSHAGIVELPEHLQAGSLVAPYYNIGAPDYAIEIGLTPNRMDAMSHMGVAKDVCAYLSNKDNTPYTQIVPDATLPAAISNNNPIQVTIANTDSCKRYAGISITNITVADSPEWLQQHLKTIGVKPINNVVDITNYVLHECGQPLHSFDAAKITGNQIIVGNAAKGQSFTTLDDKQRTLLDTDLMINNAAEPMCIAGVFGGLYSGITTSTTEVFLESAWFAPNATRLTSMHHGLRTDAAIRFEKGVDISQTIYALQRAAKLICEIAGGTICSNIIDVYPTPLPINTIDITYEYINRLSGANYSTQKIKNILLHLCFGIQQETPEGLIVAVPYAKPDITIPADIVEEIMRIDGLDSVPFTGKISFALSQTKSNTSQLCKEKIAQTLIAKGYYELFTNSITNSAYYNQEQETNLVKMLNNLSADLDAMRPSMLESGLTAISHNINRRNTDLLFFEFGKIYKQANGQFFEDEQLSIYLTGNTGAEHWQTKTKKVDIYTAKGIADSVLQCLGININIEHLETGISIGKKKKAVGTITQVSADKLKQFDIKQDVYHVVFNWAKLIAEVEAKKIQFAGIPKFASVRRDLALVINKSVSYQDLYKCIQQANAPLLQSHHVFDVFESEKLGADKKSYAINLQLMHPEKTLTDAEVEADVANIIASLEKGIGAEIRK
jgi:phenylalanyl-tRNA synthetase beta chain